MKSSITSDTVKCHREDLRDAAWLESEAEKSDIFFPGVDLAERIASNIRF